MSSFVTAVAANIISFAAGTTFTWASPEIDKLKNSPMDVTVNQGSWINSILLLGAVFGPFLFGILADKIGRKPTLLSMGFPMTIGYLLMAFVNVVEVFYVARLMIGVAVGGVFTVMPMYIGEIADSSNRGALAGILNIFICLGMLFSYMVGPYVSILVFNLILSLIPAVFIPVFFLLSVESPRYLICNQKMAEAKAILRRLRGEKSDIENEMAAIEKAVTEEGKGGFMDIFRSRGNVKAFFMATGLIFFQQFSGINAVLSNTQPIFEQAGTPISSAVCSILMGIVQLISSFLSMSLTDRLGRKLLLLGSGIGMVISELPLGIYSYLKDHDIDVKNASFLPIICLVLYIVTYNTGMGSLPWTVMGELFPSSIKSIASSVTSSFCWFLAFLIVNYFDSVTRNIGLGPCFGIFGIFCAISVVFVKIVCIETKGKTLEEIQEELNNNVSNSV